MELGEDSACVKISDMWRRQRVKDTSSSEARTSALQSDTRTNHMLQCCVCSVDQGLWCPCLGPALEFCDGVSSGSDRGDPWCVQGPIDNGTAAPSLQRGCRLRVYLSSQNRGGGVWDQCRGRVAWTGSEIRTLSV